MPVTHGVASSSLVQTAKQKEALKQRAFFCASISPNPGLTGFDSKEGDL